MAESARGGGRHDDILQRADQSGGSHRIGRGRRREESSARNPKHLIHLQIEPPTPPSSESNDETSYDFSFVHVVAIACRCQRCQCHRDEVL